jgi:hypothetical protein
MRYAHLSPAYLSAEVGLLDPTASPPPAPVPAARAERARKGQRATKRDQRAAKVVEFPRGIGSPHWTISATTSSMRRQALGTILAVHGRVARSAAPSSVPLCSLWPRNRSQTTRARNDSSLSGSGDRSTVRDHSFSSRTTSLVSQRIHRVVTRRAPGRSGASQKAHGGHNP